MTGSSQGTGSLGAPTTSPTRTAVATCPVVTLT